MVVRVALAICLEGSSEGDGEEVFRIGEGAGGSEGGGGEQGGDCGRREFVTVFGMYCFAGGEVQGEGGAGGVGRDGCALLREGFEVHLDARVGGVPEGAVDEAFGAEVGAEFAI